MMKTETKTKETKGKLFSFRFFPIDMSRMVASPCQIAFRMKRYHVSGEPYRRKLRGGAILAANHLSFSDPFLISSCFWYRRVFYLAAEVVMKGRLRSWLLKGTGCIKIDRNISDLEAIKKSVALLKDGRCLAVFPQGEVVRGESEVSVKSGAVLIALQAGVPIVPMYSLKRKHWYERKRIVIADPIYCGDYVKKKIPSMKDIEAASNALQEAMSRCQAVCEKLEAEK